jgi:hypothetical protein
VNDELFDPMFAPFTFHWNEGELPPFTGVAINNTGDPTQAGFDVDAMVTLAGKLGLTIAVIEFDTAGFPVAQERSEVR